MHLLVFIYMDTTNSDIKLLVETALNNGMQYRKYLRMKTSARRDYIKPLH